MFLWLALIRSNAANAVAWFCKRRSNTVLLNLLLGGTCKRMFMPWSLCCCCRILLQCFVVDELPPLVKEWSTQLVKIAGTLTPKRHSHGTTPTITELLQAWEDYNEVHAERWLDKAGSFLQGLRLMVRLYMRCSMELPRLKVGTQRLLTTDAWQHHKTLNTLDQGVRLAEQQCCTCAVLVDQAKGVCLHLVAITVLLLRLWFCRKTMDCSLSF